jgi:hypothetical protein
MRENVILGLQDEIRRSEESRYDHVFRIYLCPRIIVRRAAVCDSGRVHQTVNVTKVL